LSRIQIEGGAAGLGHPQSIPQQAVRDIEHGRGTGRPRRGAGIQRWPRPALQVQEHPLTFAQSFDAYGRLQKGQAGGCMSGRAGKRKDVPRLRTGPKHGKAAVEGAEHGSSDGDFPAAPQVASCH
jgi:hypothetical protein